MDELIKTQLKEAIYQGLEGLNVATKLVFLKLYKDALNEMELEVKNIDALIGDQKPEATTDEVIEFISKHRRIKL